MTSGHTPIARCATAVLVVGASVALTACSSSSDDPQSRAPQSSTVPSTPARTTPGTASSSPAPSISEAPSGNEDLAGVVVQRSELPGEFRAQDPDTSGDADDATKDALNRCAGLPATAADRVDIVHSDDFGTETASVTSTATRYGSQASVDTDVRIFASPKVEDCLESQIRQEIGKDDNGAKLLSSSIEVTPGSGGGPANLVARAGGKFVLEGNGQKVSVYNSAFYITGPRLQVTVTFTGFGQRLDPALQQKVVTAVAARAKKA